MRKEKTCTHPEAHQEHLCELKERLPASELKRLRSDPKYVCANCGGKMHQGRHLCVPKRIKE